MIQLSTEAYRRIYMVNMRIKEAYIRNQINCYIILLCNVKTDKRMNCNRMKEDCNSLYIFSSFISSCLLFTVYNYVERK